MDDAHLGRWCDDAASWQLTEPLRPSGLRYERLDSEMSIAERLEWLRRKAGRRIEPAIGKEEEDGRKRRTPPPVIRGSYRKHCDPQPYTQLARVLRPQGVTQGAARVLDERDKQGRRARSHWAMAQQDGT